MAGCADDDDDGPPPLAHYADAHWNEADLVRGGKLYDKWWVMNGVAEPTTDFDPIWSSQSTNTRSGPDTWRCKECHGWDYLGVDGAYGSGSHRTGFAGVWAARLLNRTAVFDAIKDLAGGHDLSGVLADTDVLDLTKLVIDGLIDMRLYINYATKASLGDSVAGQPLFEANCMVCHGADGRQINFGSEADPEYLGTLANDNPWETFHKLRWGHPGSIMPSMVQAGLTISEQSNLLAHTQTLPTTAAISSLISREW